MTKHVLIALIAAFLLAGRLQAAEVPASNKVEKFYGKVVSIDPASKTLKVFNKKRNQESSFHWDQETSFVANKAAIQPSAVGVGQYLMVSYTGEGNRNVATKVMVRPAPFQKKATP